MELERFDEILHKHNINFTNYPKTEAEYAELDGQTVLCWLIREFRANRFSEGSLLNFAESGELIISLKKLKDIDKENRRKKIKNSCIK